MKPAYFGVLGLSFLATPAYGQPLTQAQRDSLSGVADTAKLESASAVINGSVKPIQAISGYNYTFQFRDTYLATMSKSRTSTDVHVHPANNPSRDSAIKPLLEEIPKIHKGMNILGAALYVHQAFDGHLSLPSEQDIRASQKKSSWLRRPLYATVASSFASVDYLVLSADTVLAKEYDLRRDYAAAECVKSKVGVGKSNPESEIAGCIARKIGTFPVQIGPVSLPRIILRHYPRTTQRR